MRTIIKVRILYHFKDTYKSHKSSENLKAIVLGTQDYLY
jgi:hypothetical protein